MKLKPNNRGIGMAAIPKIKIIFTSSIKGSHPYGDLDFIGGHFLSIFSWIAKTKKLIHFAFTIAFGSQVTIFH